VPSTARSIEPRIVRVADGLYAEVLDRTSPLPRRLQPLLNGLTVMRRWKVVVAGTRRACTDAEHALQPWLRGVYRQLELRLAMCSFCGVVEVRDISLDLLPDLVVGRGGPRRRDELLGWYSGRRPGGRTYL
jgi:hypothetical protein